MYVLKEYKTINEDKIIKEIQNIALKNLKNKFVKLNINTIEINSLKKEVIKIGRDLNKKRKVEKLKIFLLNHCSHYVKGDDTPLNLFSKDCYKIFKINFIQ